MKEEIDVTYFLLAERLATESCICPAIMELGIAPRYANPCQHPNWHAWPIRSAGPYLYPAARVWEATLLMRVGDLVHDGIKCVACSSIHSPDPPLKQPAVWHLA